MTEAYIKVDKQATNKQIPSETSKNLTILQFALTT